MTALLVVASVVLGLLIGSFLNVVIARVPAGESVVRPRSRCPVCLEPIAARDNIPVVSWLILGRKCRNCRSPINAIYPLVEAGTACLFGVVAWRIGASAGLPAHLIVAAAFVALTVIDLQVRRLPDAVVLTSIVLTAGALLGAAIADDAFGALGRAGLGAAIGLGALLSIHLARPDAMGFGDVKLAALCGLILGWHGLTEVVLGLYVSFVLGAVVGVGLMLFGRAGRGSSIPFGPFLAAGTMLTILGLVDTADWLRDLV
ncbi:MAG: prepilin peptidase [Dehalococcoidia bacterium]